MTVDIDVAAPSSRFQENHRHDGLASSAPDPAGGIFTDARVAFADVGRPFGAPFVLSSTTGAHAGGVGSRWTGKAACSRHGHLRNPDAPAGGSLWAMRVTSSGQQQPPQRLAAGNPTAASVSTADRDRATLAWGTNSHRIDAVALAPGLASPFTNDVSDQLNAPPSVAVDGA